MSSCSNAPSIKYEMTKEERNLNNAGIRSFQDSDYISAIADYNRALAVNPSNPISRFNLAAANYAQLKSENLAQGSEIQSSQRDSLLDVPRSLYESIIKDSIDEDLTRQAAYNLGNMLYRNNDFKGSIERYKEALRINPEDDWARVNLRLAQLKLQQGGDNNEDNRDQQDQQNQDENKDEQNQDKQNNDSDKKNEQQQPNQPQQHQQAPDNMEQILKAMENAESATREKVNEKEQRQQSRRVVDKPW